MTPWTYAVHEVDMPSTSSFSEMIFLSEHRPFYVRRESLFYDNNNGANESDVWHKKRRLWTSTVPYV